MKLYFLILIFILSCSSQTIYIPKKPSVMNDLWKNNAKKDEVIRALGNNFKEIHGGIAYSFDEFKSFQSGHFFESDRLVEQFILIDEQSLEELKLYISCSWTEEQDLRPVGHTVYTIKSGKCSLYQISYMFLPGSNRYEVRWKK